MFTTTVRQTSDLFFAMAKQSSARASFRAGNFLKGIVPGSGSPSSQLKAGSRRGGAAYV